MEEGVCPVCYEQVFSEFLMTFPKHYHIDYQSLVERKYQVIMSSLLILNTPTLLPISSIRGTERLIAKCTFQYISSSDLCFYINVSVLCVPV